MIEIELPVIVVSEANRRDHHMAKYRRTANQRANIQVYCRRIISKLPDDASATITLTRLGKRNLDSDNLAGAFKAVRDEIAALLGVDDGSPRLTWVYDQEKAMPRSCDGRTVQWPKPRNISKDGTGIRIKIEVVE